MKTGDWFIRLILALLLLLAAYAMGLGWSALSHDSSGSESSLFEVASDSLSA
ncbi:MAG TPA: hypothetical protein VMH26_14225 [Burkholderiales bacterium]|nr:hypothetical protein [Burkholderiales bacterium]